MSVRKAFQGILHRDLLVFWRNFRSNSIRVFVQPMFFMLLFGVVMPRMGLFQRAYSDILVPGMLSMSIMTASAFGVGSIIGIGLFRNKEIRAHLMAPISLPLFVIEKILYGIFQAFVSAVAMLAVAFALFPGTLTFPNPLPFIAIVVLSSTVFSSFGIIVASRTDRPPTMFEVLQLIIMPLMFFGATFFPLSAMRQFGAAYWILHLLPNVYASEGMRALLTPHTAHLPLATVFAGLGLWAVPMFFLALREFKRRAIN